MTTTQRCHQISEKQAGITEKAALLRACASPSPLRVKYVEDMTFRRLSPGTIDNYLGHFLNFTAYCWKFPAHVTDEDIRSYLSFRENDCLWSSQYLRAAFSSIKFFFTHTLPRDLPVLKLYRIRDPRRLPTVLSRDEVARLIASEEDVRLHACMVTLYSCGLRVSEGLALETRDVDPAQMLLRIRNGKGRGERNVPLPGKTLQVLRNLWRSHRHHRLLFPAYHKVGRQSPSLRHGALDRPFSSRCVLDHVVAAARRAGIKKEGVTTHTLRHSYATHLLEEGVALPTIQEWLGHSSIESTRLYSHVTGKLRRAGADALDAIMSSLL